MKRMLAGLMVAVCFFAAAQPVLAVAFGPITSTYNNVVRVRASGDFYIVSSRTGTQSKFVLTDPVSDGNNVYAKASTAFLKTCASGSVTWCGTTWKNTKEYANTTVTVYLTVTSFDPVATQVRGVHYACAQMGFPIPDSCSNGAIVTLNY